MDGLSAFCLTNAKLWGHDYIDDPALILVDLCHSNVQYLLRSLLTSKYLQQIRGGRLVGLLGEPGIVVRGCGRLDIALIERLAASYGVLEFWRPPMPTAAETVEADSLIDAIEPGEGGKRRCADVLRERLIALELASGFPIGRFIYDTTLRAELRATIDRTDEALRHWAASCLGFHRWISRKVGPDAVTFVTGHLDYNPWGLVGETVRQAGGEVIWFHLAHQVPLYRIRAAAGTLNAAYHAIEAAWFDSDIVSRSSDLAGAAEAFAASFRAGFFHQPWTTSKTGFLPDGAAASARAAWRKGYGWNRDSVVVGIFAHAYSDQPLADAQLYADRYQWLARTVAFAAEHPERCWIVKLHPRDREYDQTGASGELARRFHGLAHVRFVDAPIAKGAMEAMCDIGVTLFGAPGLEMALAGRPVIVAGNGPYAGCGFVHRARDIAEYEALLLSPPAALAMTAEQVERARLYALASRVAGAPSSPLLDAITTPGSDTFWYLAESRLRQHAPAADELFEAIRCMIGGGATRCVNPVMARYAACSAAAWPSARPRLPLLDAVPLTFCVGGSGLDCLLSGFLPPEPWGSWTTEEIACIGLRLSPLVGQGAIILRLNFPFTVGRQPGHPGQSLSIYTRSSCVLDRVPLGMEGEVYFSIRIEDLTDESELVLALKTDNICRPSDIGISIDARRLGVGLSSIVISD